jgi:hypothetical protein
MSRAGDVFVIPVGDGRFGVGQVIARYRQTDLYYMAVFDRLIRHPSDLNSLEEIKQFSLLFLANSFDTMLADGGWPPLGKTSPLAHVPFPSYKVLERGKYFVESWDGSRKRLATEREVDLLDNRGGVAPIRLEKALKAHLGMVEWHPSFEKLTYEHVATRAVDP